MIRALFLTLAYLSLSGCGVQGSLSLPDRPAPAKKATGAGQVLPSQPAPVAKHEDEEPAIYQEDNFFTEDAEGNYDIRGNSGNFE